MDSYLIHYNNILKYLKKIHSYVYELYYLLSLEIMLCKHVSSCIPRSIFLFPTLPFYVLHALAPRFMAHWVGSLSWPAFYKLVFAGTLCHRVQNKCVKKKKCLEKCWVTQSQIILLTAGLLRALTADMHFESLRRRLRFQNLLKLLNYGPFF